MDVRLSATQIGALAALVLTVALLYVVRHPLRAWIVSHLKDHEVFWRVRRRYQSWVFAVARARYRSRFSRERSREAARVSLAFLRKATLGVVAATISVVACYLVEDLALDFLRQSGWSRRYLPWFVEVANRKVLVDATLYSTLVAASIGVLGVFIALFVSALATSAEPLSGRVSLVARRLLLKDPQVGVIARLFSFSVTFGILLLLLQAGGVRSSLLGLSVVAFLTALAVLVAARLVQGGFYFVDPSRLVFVPLSEIERSARRATSGGFRFLDPSFQAHYRERANASLDDVTVLWEGELQGPTVQDPNLAALGRAVMSLLPEYVGLKRQMPTESHWYERQPRHQEWYLASHAEIQVAAATETPLQPKLEPNPFWIEDAIVRLGTSSIDRSVREGTGVAASELLGYLSRFIELQGREWECEQGVKWLESISAPVSEALRDWVPDPSKPSLTDDYRLSMVDSIGLLPIALQLGMFQRAREMTVASVCEGVRRLRWKTDIYSLNLPLRGRKTLEEMRMARDFEIRSDGEVTATWYFQQLVLRALEYQLEAALQSLAELPTTFYKKQAQEAFEANRVLLAAITLTRGVEYCHKFLANFEDIERFVADASAKHVLKDLPSPTWDLEGLKSSLVAVRLELLEFLCKCIPGLAVQERPANWPDFFGRTVHTAGDLCIQAAFDLQPQTIARIFRLYLVGVLSVYEKLRQQLSDYDPQVAVTWMTEPLIDLLDVSGYCFLMSEMAQDESLWVPVRGAWTSYLDSVDRPQTLNYLATVIRLHESQFGIHPRAVWRTGWKMAVDRKLEEVPQEYENGGWMPHQVPKHESPLVRVCAREAPMGSMYSGMDIFVDLYLSQLPEAAGLEFRTRYRLIDSLDHPAGREEDVVALIRRATGQDNNGT
ncbi:MAG: hypothetical protein GEU68_13335 [Actinobacteria bacterium]|nr:hypothetical protein [Actinomycetota bacterium]